MHHSYPSDMSRKQFDKIKPELETLQMVVILGKSLLME